MSRLTCMLLAVVTAGGFLAPLCVGAQASGPGTGGAVAHARATVAEGNWKRVLMVGAHPDDEYNDLIALLARGRGIETAYLSLTRGEGGQNLIGNELGVALGLLRTEELIAARRIDGGRQFFTRAFDFGFSKTADETFRFWPHDSLLLDVVRVIRAFKPQVIVSVWSGTARDGHGHHTVAGMIAREAFDVAADPSRFPEAGPAFRPSKFYLAPYTLAADAPMLVLEGGAIEPASGLSYHQLAARSRSQHRSQDMGSLEEPGPWPVRVALAALAPGVRATPAESLFAGIAADAPEPGRADSIRAVLRIGRANVVFDAYANDDEIATGDSATVTLLAWNAGRDTVSVRMVLPTSGSWFAMRGPGSCGDRAPLAPGAKRTCHLVVTNTGGRAQPYFLRVPMDGSMYRWSGATHAWGLPFELDVRPTFVATFRDGSEAAQSVEVRGRFLDQATGEVRRPLVGVPRIALEMQPSRVLWRQGERSRVMQVHLEHMAHDTTKAIVALDVPDGWTVGAPQQLTLTRENERATVEFTVTAPAVPPQGEVIFRAAAVVGADTLRHAIHRIDYPHISRRTYFTPSESAVVVAPVTFVQRVKAGYVRGAADLIPEALADAGVTMHVLEEGALDSYALDSIDVLVIGPRAYEISDAVRRANPRIIEWVRGGGTLIVQYQQYQYVRGAYAPRPFTISRPHDRVTDEAAAVTILDPAHPIFRYPNAIGADDFNDWRQERGLYFAGTWDDAWTPLLEMHDAGEEPQRGSLLVAPLGRGNVVYTGLAFFRQIPAAVPGAWRLFANLLALGERRGR
ncbi:MAG: PIG-L family deacetylase [Gemmatimonadales bacterium]|nr:PIG-L family deacetylase [Gemmatimonadales bacterium]